jgi:16S rRNA (guanine527-N7)-methyltransferase
LRDDSAEFAALLAQETQIPSGQQALLVRFRELVCEENERQNLTRLLSPRDFFDGHILDCIELENSGFLGESALDLGAGAGVPGIPCAILRPRPWILTDSEQKKAQFIARAAEELGLKEVSARGERAEAVLKRERVETVVARAVGKIAKIYVWLKDCSTWNKIVLLKGPGWEQEWAEFLESPHRNKLLVSRIHDYQVGSDHKARRLIELVPRGTK